MAKRGVAANRARGHFCAGEHFAPRGDGVLRGGVFLFQGNFRGNFAWGGILDGDVLRGGAFFSREISAVTLRGPPRLRELLQ